MARITLAISRGFPKPGTSGPVIMVVTESHDHEHGEDVL